MLDLAPLAVTEKTLAKQGPHSTSKTQVAITKRLILLTQSQIEQLSSSERNSLIIIMS